MRHSSGKSFLLRKSVDQITLAAVVLAGCFFRIWIVVIVLEIYAINWSQLYFFCSNIPGTVPPESAVGP